MGHAAVIRHTGLGTVSLYVDDNLVDTTEDNITGTILPGRDVEIGVKNKSSGREQYFVGSIDEVIILDGPLCETDLVEYVQSGQPWSP